MSFYKLKTSVRERALARTAALSVGAALLAVVAIVSTAAASNSRKRSGRAAASSNLTMAIAVAPQSLDPSKDDAADGLFAAELLYEPLIHETYSGGYTPGLAVAWHYVGKGNKKFELTIRSGAKFSDGEPVTAAAVAAGLVYNSKGTGNAGSTFTGLKAKAVGNKVLITVTTPVNNFPGALSQDSLTADIPCPKALSSPASLASQPCGAGPYVLDSSATVSGSKYVFTPDPNYYDPAAIHYKSVTLQVISSPTSALEALRTGQVQVYTDTNLGMYAAAKAAGLNVRVLGETAFTPIWIMDRFGKIDKPLGNVLVRQALNFAVDRSAIAKATYGPLGVAFDEPVTPGLLGYDPAVASYYRYDPTLAKKLLARAGYPHGFSFSVLYITSQSVIGTTLQALVPEFARIGVKLKLVPETGFPPFSAAQATKKYEAFSLGPWSGTLAGTSSLLWGGHNGANAFYADTPAFLKLYKAAGAASGADVDKASEALTAYTVKQAWFITVAATKSFVLATKGVNGLPPTGSVEPDGFDVTQLQP